MPASGKVIGSIQDNLSCSKECADDANEFYGSKQIAEAGTEGASRGFLITADGPQSLSTNGGYLSQIKSLAGKAGLLDNVSNFHARNLFTIASRFGQGFDPEAPAYMEPFGPAPGGDEEDTAAEGT
jgi:hypothetical protein